MTENRLQSFFLECARKSFWDLGLRDNAVIEYVSHMLAAFAHADHLYRLHAADGRRLDSLVEILSAQLDAATPRPPHVQRERELRRYVGDYALFMSGLFRSSIEKIGVLDYYFQEGRRSYWKVSELDLALYQTGFLLFQELSKNFEYYSGALDYMRKACFATAPEENPFGQFLRQVEGWMKIGISRN
ncbi:MAG TPA: hypothetical protein VNN62_04125 [Methylomirabilota bacterium]|nr:hypothetical protein [Methylomirabilota bacterium]